MTQTTLFSIAALLALAGCADDPGHFALGLLVVAGIAGFLWLNRDDPPPPDPEVLFGPRPANWSPSKGGGFVRASSDVFAFANEWPNTGCIRLSVSRTRDGVRRTSETRHATWAAAEAHVQKLIAEWRPRGAF